MLFIGVCCGGSLRVRGGPGRRPRYYAWSALAPLAPRQSFWLVAVGLAAGSAVFPQKPIDDAAQVSEVPLSSLIAILHGQVVELPASNLAAVVPGLSATGGAKVLVRAAAVESRAALPAPVPE